MLEEHVKAKQKEQTAAQATLEELTSKANMELQRGGECNHLETDLGTNPRAHRNNVAGGTSSTESERDGTSSSDSLWTLQVTQRRAQHEESHERATK